MLKKLLTRSSVDQTVSKPVEPEINEFYYRTPDIEDNSYREIVQMVRHASLELGQCLERNKEIVQDKPCQFELKRVCSYLEKINARHPSDPEAKLAIMSVSSGRLIQQAAEEYRQTVAEMLTTSYGQYIVEEHPTLIPYNRAGQELNMQALLYEEKLPETRILARETLALRDRVNRKPDRHFEEYHREIKPDDPDYDLDEYWLQAGRSL